MFKRAERADQARRARGPSARSARDQARGARGIKRAERAGSSARSAQDIACVLEWFQLRATRALRAQARGARRILARRARGARYISGRKRDGYKLSIIFSFPMQGRWKPGVQNKQGAAQEMLQLVFLHSNEK